MRAHRAWLLGLLACLAACDGDGCGGGPNGPATQSCQRSLGNLELTEQQLESACRQCCVQEVPYRGTIENGVCVCRR